MNTPIENGITEEYIQWLIDKKRLELHGIIPEQANDQSNWIKPKKEIKRVEKPTFSSDIKYLANSRGCLPYRESSMR